MKKKMDVNSTEIPDFFKVFLPEYSSERMLVPIAFVAKLNKPIPRNTILQCRSGSHWPIKVVKQDHKVYFQEGWQKFVRDNSIETGDFLVFSYDCGNKFDVAILKNSMYEEEMFSNVREEMDRQRMAKEEGKIEIGKEERKNEKDDGEKGFDMSGVGNNDFNVHHDSDDEEEQLNETTDEDYNDEDYTDDSDSNDEVELVEEDEEISKFTDYVDVEDHNNNTGEDSQNLKRKIRYHKNDAGESSKSRENNLVEEKYIQTSNPCFAPNLAGRGLRYLHVPLSIFKDLNLKLCSKIQFHDPLGRKWYGVVLVRKNGYAWRRVHIKGWKVVCQWNNIKEGDHCICELLLGKNSICANIKVHIINRS